MNLAQVNQCEVNHNMVKNESIEFKLFVNEDISREVVAFANLNGGIIYVGIDDHGTEVGLQDVDDAYTRLTNIIRDAILPDITMFIKYELLINNIIKVSISEGSAKPYYLKNKGMKPSGVYIRQGTSSVQASWELIRQLIKNADGDSFESHRSILQDLSFSTAKIEFKKRNIEFSKEKYISLGIWDAEMKLFTNLAQLLSDQCEHTVKVAVFDDSANTVFIDRREFGGSVFKQLHDTYEYLLLNNRTASEIRELDRYDYQDYPPEAIREALLNALVHRDYSFSGSIIININSERMEFINLGGLLPGLTANDIINGISQPRNAKLAQAFFRLKHIEAYGTGIRRIFELYRDKDCLPEIVVSDNTFRITLPNYNYHRKFHGQSTTKNHEKLTTSMNQLTPQMKAVLDYLVQNETISEEDMLTLLNLKRTRTYTIAREMVERGLIVREGRGKNKYYELP